jgi:hypothetical protein
MLSYQLLKEVYGFLIDKCGGIEARYMFVHSGGKVDIRELEVVREKWNNDNNNNVPFSEIGSGTSSKEVRSMMKKAKKDNLPVIFFSTYNSATRIEEARKRFTEQEISIVLNDEAHYLVQERFYDILTILKSERCYFFTATMIKTPSDIGRGMDNVESYGEELYKMTPREAINVGKMVRPRLHYVITEGIYTTEKYNTEEYDKNLCKIIADTFKQHEEVLAETKQLPKILISTRGTLDIFRFLRSNEYQELRNQDVDIYAVASTLDIGNCINPIFNNSNIINGVTRQEFLKKLKKDGEDKTKKILVLHFDILAEGIDVSGFTGIMPLRTLNKTKFMQTFGRSARPDKEDRIKIAEILKNKTGELLINNGKDYRITTEEWNTMNKPFSYIIIPTVIQANQDDKENFVQLIKELRSEYDYDPSEYIISEGSKRSIIKKPPTGSDSRINPHFQGRIIERLNYLLEDIVSANINEAIAIDGSKKTLDELVDEELNEV